MFGFFRRILGIGVERSPVPGEKWVLKGDLDGPWPSDKDYLPVDILDVKKGWVRYAMGSTFPDCRMRIKTFTSIYRALA